MKEYVIQDSLGTQATILPEKGATAVSLIRDGTEFLYADWENLRSDERPRCGIPFLFPIFGRLKDSRYTWDGQEYHMEIHGFGHTSVWSVAEHTESCLKLVLEANEETLQQYPFQFRATLVFELEGGALTIRQIYENLGNIPMPYNYGFHPYFYTDKLENLAVETTAKTLFDFAKGLGPFGHGTLQLTMPPGAPEIGAALMGVESPTILHNSALGTRLTMSFDASFHTHVLWTQAGKPFLCVEPINGAADGLNTGTYMTLEPGGRQEAYVRFQTELN